jgi:hypothetical protein
MDRDQVIVEESGRTVVEVDDGVDVRSVVVDSETISVVAALEQGPPGVGADKHYEESFITSNSITVNHNLGKKPSVQVTDSAGTEIVVDVIHISNNQLHASWSGAFSGVIFCN